MSVEIASAVISAIALIVVGYLQFRPPKKEKKPETHITKSEFASIQKQLDDATDIREEAYNALSKAIAEYILSGSNDATAIMQKLDRCKECDCLHADATKKFLNDLTSRMFDDHKE